MAPTDVPSLSERQRLLLREVLAQEPELLPLADGIENAPLRIRNDVRDAILSELMHRELVDEGNDVTARGHELEELIDAIGPRPGEGQAET